MKITEVIRLDPQGVGNFQAVFPGEFGGWFVTRDDNGTLVIDRHSAAGTYRDSCRLTGAGHVTGAGEVLGTILTTHAGDLVRFKYQPGKVLSRKDVAVLDAFVKGEAQVSLSPSLSRVVVRERPGDGYSHFRRYLTSDLLTGRNRLIGKAISISRKDPKRVEQSFGLVNESLFVGYGAINERNWLEQWSFDTGKRVPGVEIDLTKWALIPGEKHEIEFAPGRLLHMKVGSSSKRRLVIGKHDLLADLNQAA